MKLILEISSYIIYPLMYIFNKSFDDGLLLKSACDGIFLWLINYP